MNITKYGHSCLLVEEAGERILIDPGTWSEVPADLSGISAILITHDHQDHADPAKVQTVLRNNPSAVVMTNTAVGKVLAEHDIAFQILEDSQSAKIGELTVEGFGNDHALIHPDIPLAQNTGYLINGQLWHPGDSLFIPPKPVKILALPIVAPWEKVSETMDYLTAVKPQICVPIHDGFLKFEGLYDHFAKVWCDKIGAKYVELPMGQIVEV